MEINKSMQIYKLLSEIGPNVVKSRLKVHTKMLGQDLTVNIKELSFNASKLKLAITCGKTSRLHLHTLVEVA